MSKTSLKSTDAPSLKPLKWICGITIPLSLIGLGLWGWMLKNRDNLPAIGTEASQRLLGQYLATAHDIFLILLAITAVLLVRLISKFQRNEATETGRLQKPPLKALFDFGKEQPISLILFAAYTVAMVQGTTWFYPELVGWYSDVVSDHLLNNFSFHSEFISETMRRRDFRFFPLAHQDLHVLSWFTAYVKVWMLVSAAELIAIVVLSTRFIRRLSSIDDKQGAGILIITALLLMIHPSTAEGFFQLIYCERLLTLIFILYASSYLHYQKTNSNASFYSTFMFGLIGIFIKDIAAILFIIPPITSIAFGFLGWDKNHDKWSLNSLKKFLKDYRLELWLLTLISIFIFSYTYLSLLPSSYISQGSYSDKSESSIEFDWRFTFLILLTTSRLIMAGLGRLRLQLLDALNIASISYAGALFILVSFKSYSYLSLPVHLVTTLNIVWLWSSALAPQINRKLPWRITAAIGTTAAVIVLILESNPGQPSFTKTVQWIKNRQSSWLGAYTKVNEIAREIRQKGEPVNIIYNSNSWFSRERHLGKINYDRLIGFDPDDNSLRIEDGIDSGAQYSPLPGDLILNIDKSIYSLKPIFSNSSYEQLYRHNKTDDSGAIYRLQP